MSLHPSVTCPSLQLPLYINRPLLHYLAISSPMAPLLLCLLTLLFHSTTATTTPRKLILVQQQPLVLQYHNGPLLTGNLTVRLLWYGSFSAAHRGAVSDFILSLSSTSRLPSPSVADWWSTTTAYRRRPIALSLGPQLIDDRYSLGKSLSSSDLLSLASRGPHRSSITAILTSSDVTVEGFCSSRCATHSSAPSHPNRPRSAKFPFLWVGDSSNQCPGQCAWPFHQPIYGPQTPPLIPPNADVGIDGMIINLGTVLAGAVTNPFQSGFFQGPPEAPLEAVTACTGVFGSGAYPGYPGRVLSDRTTGSSFNAYGINGRKYLLPSMWDPSTSQCSTLV